MNKILFLCLSFLIILTNFTFSKNLKKIYITPGWWGQLFLTESSYYNRDNCLEPMVKLKEVLKENGYELIQVNSLKNLVKPELIICFDIGIHYQLNDLKNYPIEKVVFLWEPPIFWDFNFKKEYHNYFSKIFTWYDDYVDNKKYFKFYYPRLKPMVTNTLDFEKKKFCTFVVNNKFYRKIQNELLTSRERIISFFEKYKGILDLYGKGWKYKNFKGSIVNKIDCIKNYKFCICIENMSMNGYITEKIFDCFASGCIPVYLGAKNIENYIPKSCFIDFRDFANEQKLYEFMKKMTKQEYNEYINKIQEFLLSENAYLFSIDNFIKIFLNLIQSV